MENNYGAFSGTRIDREAIAFGESLARSLFVLHKSQIVCPGIEVGLLE
jgi:hypothetical protein